MGHSNVQHKAARAIAELREAHSDTRGAKVHAARTSLDQAFELVAHGCLVGIGHKLRGDGFRDPG